MVRKGQSGFFIWVADMPISVPADWRDSFWLSEYEPWTVSGNITGFSVRQKRHPLPQLRDAGVQIAEYLYHSSWIVVELLEYRSDSSLVIAFHDGSTHFLSPDATASRTRGCAQGASLGVTVQSALQSRRQLSDMSSYNSRGHGASRGRSSARVAAARPPVPTAEDLHLPCCLCPGCPYSACPMDDVWTRRTSDLAPHCRAPATRDVIFSDGSGMFCPWHRMYYSAPGAAKVVEHLTPELRMHNSVTIRKGQRAVVVPCLGGTDSWIFISNAGVISALPRQYFDEMITTNPAEEGVRDFAMPGIRGTRVPAFAMDALTT